MNTEICLVALGVLLTAVHWGAVGWLRRGLRALPTVTGSKGGAPVSIVIAARNEAGTISSTLHALLAQDFSGPLEVVLVDDRSTDGTADVARRSARGFRARDDRHFRIIRIDDVPPGRSPKKHALAAGLDAARHELIAFTDADTEPAPGWLRGMLATLGRNTGLVIGHAPVHGHGLVGKWASFEGHLLAILAAASVGAGYPLTCTGRSLLYRRSALLDAGGLAQFSGLGAGDDDLLLGAVRDQTTWNIAFCVKPASRVATKAPETFQEWSQQRRRHASNGFRFAPRIVAAMVAFYVYHAVPLFLLGQALLTDTGLGPVTCALALWGARGWIDSGILRDGAELFERRQARLLPYLMQPCISAVVCGIVPWGIFGGYTWKGAQYPRGRVPTKEAR